MQLIARVDHEPRPCTSRSRPSSGLARPRLLVLKHPAVHLLLHGTHALVGVRLGQLPQPPPARPEAAVLPADVRIRALRRLLLGGPARARGRAVLLPLPGDALAPGHPRAVVDLPAAGEQRQPHGVVQVVQRLLLQRGVAGGSLAELGGT